MLDGGIDSGTARLRPQGHSGNPFAKLLPLPKTVPIGEAGHRNALHDRACEERNTAMWWPQGKISTEGSKGQPGVY